MSIDLRTGINRAPRREDYCTKIAAVAPAPEGTPCPMWTSFLRRVTNKVLRAVEWVIFSHFDPLSVIVFVVAVGMWATRLRCPSCPQRCCTIASWSFRQGGAVLTIDQNDKGRF
jgi:hypothetical protein